MTPEEMRKWAAELMGAGKWAEAISVEVSAEICARLDRVIELLEEGERGEDG